MVFRKYSQFSLPPLTQHTLNLLSNLLANMRRHVPKRSHCPHTPDPAVACARLTFAVELDECGAGQRSADLQTLTDHRGRDQLVGRHLLVELVIGGLVEQHQVVELVTDLSLGPLLQDTNRTRSQQKQQKIANQCPTIC